MVDGILLTFRLKLKLRVIQFAHQLDAHNTSTQNNQPIQWIIQFQTSDKIMISLAPFQMKKLPQKLLVTNGIGKNNQMVHQETILFQTLVLMRISKTFKLQLPVKKTSKVTPGHQLKMLTDTGLFQKLLIILHMLITKTNISTTTVWFNWILKREKAEWSDKDQTQSAPQPVVVNTSTQRQLPNHQETIQSQISDKTTIS